MQEPMDMLTDQVAQSAERLKQHYGARRLHILRVGVRRIRTYLKQSGNHRAKRMRKIWGGFAGATNDARDWDVFHRTARVLLEPDEYQAFKRLNRKWLEASHRAVRTMVNSAHWDRHLEEWRRYLAQSASLSPAIGNGEPCRSPLAGDQGPGRPQAASYNRGAVAREQPSLDAALEKAGAALSRALQSDDDRAWHKFRIAVKETRYIADAISPLPAEVRQVITTCKSLQATLGEWHDTVIQLQLLDELEPHPAHARLQSLIRQRKALSLSQTRALLGAQSIFAPTRCGDSPGRAT
jgi:CHAD domain-containing protein